MATQRTNARTKGAGKPRAAVKSLKAEDGGQVQTPSVEVEVSEPPETIPQGGVRRFPAVSAVLDSAGVPGVMEAVAENTVEPVLEPEAEPAAEALQAQLQPVQWADPSEAVEQEPPQSSPLLRTAINIVTGTIGGVGKTQFAHLLASYYFEQMLTTGRLQPIHLVEGDHKGTKFHKTYQALPAPFDLMVEGLHQTMLSDDPAKQSNSDFVAELALSGTPVVVNTPANSAEAMTDWLLNSDIPALCEEAGVPLRYWFVIRNSPDSLDAFLESMQNLGDVVPHVLVKNQYQGQGTQPGEWHLPSVLEQAVQEDQVPVVTMPSLYVQNQQFSERFNLPFLAARAYDSDSFTLTYWHNRLAARDLLITRWLEWTGSNPDVFLTHWRSYWHDKGLVYAGSRAEKALFERQHDIPLASVGRNRLNKFLNAGFASIAAATRL